MVSTEDLTSTTEADFDFSKDKELISPSPQIPEESKSDDATSIPDEECLEVPIILQLDLKTKDGVKRIEFKTGDDVTDITNKIAQEYGLSKGVETAIEYKIRKALMNTGDQHILFK